MCRSAPLALAPSQATRVSGLLRSAKSTSSASEYTFVASMASREVCKLRASCWICRSAGKCQGRSGAGGALCARVIPVIAAFPKRRTSHRHCRFFTFVSRFQGWSIRLGVGCPRPKKVLMKRPPAMGSQHVLQRCAYEGLEWLELNRCPSALPPVALRLPTKRSARGSASDLGHSVCLCGAALPHRGVKPLTFLSATASQRSASLRKWFASRKGLFPIHRNSQVPGKCADRTLHHAKKWWRETDVSYGHDSCLLQAAKEVYGAGGAGGQTGW